MYSASWDIRIFRVSKWKSIVKEKEGTKVEDLLDKFNEISIECGN